MKIVDVIQGTPEWHAHRAAHRNASDAPAMMNASPYKSRAQLLKELATGIVPEVDSYTQKRFDNGHAFEKQARKDAEVVLADFLYPVTGTLENLSASFDGLTESNDVAWEHKTLNDELRGIMPDNEIGNRFVGERLPFYHRIQLEQQLHISGAEKALFTASKWKGEELIEIRHCWYHADLPLRSQILAGWEQFEKDLAEYRFEEAAPAPVAAAPTLLPALRIEVMGMVTASNLDAYKAAALATFDGIKTDLQTDQDFADAEQAVKWCGDVEAKLKLAKEVALSQTADIDALFRAIDEISEQARQKRLTLDKAVKTRKEAIRVEIVQGGMRSLTAHVDTLNFDGDARVRITVPANAQGRFAEAIKGKKTVASLREATDAALLEMKLELSALAKKIASNIAIYDGMVTNDMDHLFDLTALASTKDAEDFIAIIKARLQDEQARRDQIAAQAAEAERKQQERIAEEAKQAESVVTAPPPVIGTAGKKGPAQQPAPETESQVQRPTRQAIIIVLSQHYGVSYSVVAQWLAELELAA